METLYELCKTDIWSRISVAQNIDFLANKSCIKCIDSAMFVVNTKEINKNEVFEAYFCYSGPLTEKFAIILS